MHPPHTDSGQIVAYPIAHYAHCRRRVATIRGGRRKLKPHFAFEQDGVFGRVAAMLAALAEQGQVKARTRLPVQAHTITVGGAEGQLAVRHQHTMAVTQGKTKTIAYPRIQPHAVGAVGIFVSIVEHTLAPDPLHLAGGITVAGLQTHRQALPVGTGIQADQTLDTPFLIVCPSYKSAYLAFQGQASDWIGASHAGAQIEVSPGLAIARQPPLHVIGNLQITLAVADGGPQIQPPGGPAKVGMDAGEIRLIIAVAGVGVVQIDLAPGHRHPGQQFGTPAVRWLWRWMTKTTFA